MMLSDKILSVNPGYPNSTLTFSLKKEMKTEYGVCSENHAFNEYLTSYYGSETVVC